MIVIISPWQKIHPLALHRNITGIGFDISRFYECGMLSPQRQRSLGTSPLR